MSASGTPLDQINQALIVSDQPATNALITVADFAQSLQIASDRLASMQNKLDQTNDRLDALTAWLALPFFKRLFKKPPL